VPVVLVPGSKAGKQAPQQTALLEPCLGVLIVDFFRLFGRVLNMRDVGMASSGGGHYFRKVCVYVAKQAGVHCCHAAYLSTRECMQQNALGRTLARLGHCHCCGC